MMTSKNNVITSLDLIFRMRTHNFRILREILKRNHVMTKYLLYLIPTSRHKSPNYKFDIFQKVLSVKYKFGTKNRSKCSRAVIL